MLTPLGMGLTGAGAGLGMIGSIFGGISAKKDAKASAKLAKYNQMLALRAAETTRQETGFAQMRQTEEGARIKGEQLASLGASGAVVSEGANLAAQAKQASELDIQNFLIGYEGAKEVEKFKQQAYIYSQQAKQYKKQGKAALWGGILGGTGTALTGFGGMMEA